ncbi:MAG: alpha/beta fold hydrolase [Pseudomonadota bacterium]
MNLFCIPYAGGSEDVFNDWQELFAPVVDIRAACLPGRGSRFGEAPIDEMSALIEDLAAQCETDAPLALLGYSFGAIVAYALALHLEERGRSLVRLVIGGARAPFLPPLRPLRHRMTDEELGAQIAALNGTAPEVLAHREMMAMFLPILRADFRVVETFDPSRKRVRCPLTVLGGRQDAIVPLDDLMQWRRMSEGKTTLRLYDGNHFVIHSEMPRICRAIRADLTRDTMAFAIDCAS